MGFPPAAACLIALALAGCESEARAGVTESPGGSFFEGPRRGGLKDLEMYGSGAVYRQQNVPPNHPNSHILHQHSPIPHHALSQGDVVGYPEYSSNWRHWYMRKGIHQLPAPGTSGKPPNKNLASHRSGSGVYSPDEEEFHPRVPDFLGPAPIEDLDLEEGVEGCGGFCRSGEYLCVDSCTCIPVSWRCDGTADCVNGDDEASCTPSAPQQMCDIDTHIRCPRTWRCIKKDWVCDGDDDCGDFSDETHCGLPLNCTSEEFECNNGLCIPVSWLCDGENDCRDFSDEINCTKKSDCTKEEFKCTDGSCISMSWRCDMEPDCSDQSDELDCPIITPPVCEEGEIQCAYPRCVREEYRCDGDDDCGDWSDEEGCPKIAGGFCAETEFRCNSGKCISKRWQCDGERDCEEGEDELNCESVPPRSCSGDEFTCKMGNCIPKSWVCDGVQDCSQGEDEAGCQVTCDAQTQFTCLPLNSTYPTIHCILKKHVCDIKYDCPRGDDEVNCPKPKNCSQSSIKCKQLCIETHDGKDACSCKPGYTLMDDGFNCGDVDECGIESEPVCSQSCNNTVGSYLCGCYKGYTLRPDGKSCKALGAPPTLLFANRIDIRQVSLNNLKYIGILKGLHNAIALDFHYAQGYIYWSDVSMDVIRRARTNGTNATDIIRWGLNSPAGVAVDWIHDLLFWTDSGTRRVEVSKLDGTIRHVLASDDLDKPRAIAVHPGEALVFWTDWGPQPKIERCELDGSNRMVIVKKSLLWPNGLSIDYPANKIYWADAKHHVIECSKLDGSDRKKVVAKGLPHPFALTLFEDAIYWTDWHTKSISTANKATGSGLRTIHSGLHYPMDIHSFHPQRQPSYTNHCGSNNGGCSHLCLPNAHSFQCVCPLGYKLTKNNRTCDTTTDIMLLFARMKDLRLRSLHASPSSYDVVIPIQGIKSAVALAWDSEHKAVYWSDIITGTISSSKINGEYQQEVISSNLESPAGISIDWVTNKLYWTDASTKVIEVSNMDGSMRSLLIWEGLDKPRDIAVDPLHGWMYWSDWGENATIERAGMDGKNRSTFLSENIKWPNGLALDYPTSRIYWTDAGIHTIEYVGFDGKGRTVLLSDLPHPFGLSVYNNKVYWTDWETRSIHVVDKNNGKNNHVLRSGISGLMDIRIMDHEKDIVQSKCFANNAGCSHLCLLAPNDEGYVCACPIGIKLLDDSKTCAASPSIWLIVAHRQEIRQIALDVPYTVDVVLPFPLLHSTVAIDVDDLTGDIYWSDTGEDVIQKAQPDGSGLETIVADRLDTADGIAIDSAGRKLYWADAGSNSIQVCDLNNCEGMRRVLIWNHLDSPRAITLDYELGLLFWADWGTNPRIEQADMDGKNRMTLVSENLGWPNGLTIDNGQLYWTDAKLLTIETSSLNDAPNRTVLLKGLPHPYAVVILDNFIYWTDWQNKAVHRANKLNGSGMTTVVKDLEGLMDIKAVKRKDVPDNVCGFNNGGCSHLCLRSPKGYTCSCPTGILIQDDKRTCHVQPNAYLLFATGSSLVRISLDTPDMWDVTLPTPGIHKAVDVDFHWNRSSLFYADVHLGSIRAVSMSQLTKTWDVVTNISKPEGLAIDWLADNIYWTDSKEKTLEVARIDGTGRKVIISNIEEPKSVAVYPRRGYLYWTDWGESRGIKSKIERSYLDGSIRNVILGDLGLPNGLAIDYHTDRLYWADAYKDRIEMSELDGNGRVQLVPEATHPFGLTQFKDHIYWTDWFNIGVERADGLTGRDRTVLRGQVYGVLEIRAVSPEKQTGWNPCVLNNGYCTHFCLFKGRNGYVCSCPDHPTTTKCSTEASKIVPNPENLDNPDDKEEKIPEDTPLPKGSSTALLVTAVILCLVVLAVASVIIALLYHRRQRRQKKYMYTGGRSVLTFSNPNYSISISDEGRQSADKKPFIWRKLRYDKSQDRVFAVHGDGEKGGSAEVVSLIPVPAASPCPSPTPTSSIALEPSTSNC